MLHGGFKLKLREIRIRCVRYSAKWLVYPVQTFTSAAKIHHRACFHGSERIEKENCCETASGLNVRGTRTFRFAPCKSIRFYLKGLNFTFRFRPRNWSRPAEQIDFADFSHSCTPLLFDDILCWLCVVSISYQSLRYTTDGTAALRSA